MAKISHQEAEQFRVGADFRIADVDPAATPGLRSGRSGSVLDNAFTHYDAEIEELQELLYANGRGNEPGTGSILLVLQGMDTAGKGGIIAHSVSAVMDAQGVHTKAFGRPTEEEAKHDFLWRFQNHLPEPGQVVVFDRSYYEDVLVQRVKQMAPPEEIERRYGAIVEFEKKLTEQGTRIIKVMPHISREFQAMNLRERIENPKKFWKYDPRDIDDRKLWDEFMEAYEIAFQRTSTDFAPWYCIPSDNKKYCRTVVKTLIHAALKSLDLKWPERHFDPEVELKRLAES